jgi:hypothetical protein
VSGTGFSMDFFTDSISATAADVNPFSGAMSLAVAARLSSATRWYVTADPGEVDVLEFAYLSGNEGPQVESRSGWDVDWAQQNDAGGGRRIPALDQDRHVDDYADFARGHCQNKSA